MKPNQEQERPCLTRRQFLLASGSATLTTVLLPSLPGLLSRAEAVPATLASYPKKKDREGQRPEDGQARLLQIPLR